MTRLLALIVVLAACSGTPVTTTTVTDILSELPECPQAGDVLTEEMTEGCLEGDSVTVLGIWECADGRRLWGEGDLWAFVGETVVQTSGDSAADPGYADAYAECSP